MHSSYGTTLPDGRSVRGRCKATKRLFPRRGFISPGVVAKLNTLGKARKPLPIP